MDIKSNIEDKSEITIQDGSFILMRKVNDDETFSNVNTDTKERFDIIRKEWLIIVLGNAKNNQITHMVNILWKRGGEPYFLPTHKETRFLTYDIIRSVSNICTLNFEVDDKEVYFTWSGGKEKVYPAYSDVPSDILEKAKVMFWEKIFDECCKASGWYQDEKIE